MLWEHKMPKAILEFSLPEEEQEHARALNGGSMHALIWDLLQELRKAEKYEAAFGEKLKDGDCVIIGKMRDWLHDEIERRGLQDSF
jgi:hypothetical protein